MKVLTWLWQQEPNLHNYDAEKVNVWAAMVSRHLTLPHTIACVTDTPEGIDPSIEIIPLPEDFADIKLSNWKESKGWPQCYRRLSMFAPDAEQRFGTDRIISMDLDVVICGNLDGLFTHNHPFKIYKGTSDSRPYNGSLMDIRVGTRPQLYEQFSFTRAVEARRRYLGSDQAWIAYALGWIEPTWGKDDGVHFFQPGFAKKYLHEDSINPLPQGICLLAFPGFVKPWHLLSSDWIREHWRIDAPFDKPAVPHKMLAKPRQSTQQTTPQPPSNTFKPGKSGRYATPTPATVEFPEAGLWAYNGRTDWGKTFKKAAKSLGIVCNLFTRAEEVPDGAKAFVRLDQYKDEREKTKEMVEALHERGVTTLPTLRESRWYDDKVAQLYALRQWLPETWVIRDKTEGVEMVHTFPYPLVSKASEGASSANVRLVEDVQQALTELDYIDETERTLSYGRRQKGYVYFQRLIPAQSCDYRVNIIGDKFFGLIRDVPPGDFRASGGGLIKPFTMQTEREHAAVDFVQKIAKQLGTRWMCFDVVFQDGRPYVLEMSSSWALHTQPQYYLFGPDRIALANNAGNFAACVEAVSVLAGLQ